MGASAIAPIPHTLKTAVQNACDKCFKFSQKGTPFKPTPTPYHIQYPAYTWPPIAGHQRAALGPPAGPAAAAQISRQFDAPHVNSPQWRPSRRRAHRASDASANGHRNWWVAHRRAKGAETSTSAPCTAVKSSTKCSAYAQWNTKHLKVGGGSGMVNLGLPEFLPDHWESCDTVEKRVNEILENHIFYNTATSFWDTL